MTLEEAGREAIAAAEAGDLKAVDAALKARAAAIALLAGTPPSEELAARLASAIQAGDALNRCLSTLRSILKVRLLNSTSRLALIRNGLTAGLAPPSRTSIDCRG
jgi:hypothetical protein